MRIFKSKGGCLRISWTLKSNIEERTMDFVEQGRYCKAKSWTLQYKNMHESWTSASSQTKDKDIAGLKRGYWVEEGYYRTSGTLGIDKLNIVEKDIHIIEYDKYWRAHAIINNKWDIERQVEHYRLRSKGDLPNTTNTELMFVCIDW